MKKGKNKVARLGFLTRQMGNGTVLTPATRPNPAHRPAAPVPAPAVDGGW